MPHKPVHVIGQHACLAETLTSEHRGGIQISILIVLLWVDFYPLTRISSLFLCSPSTPLSTAHSQRATSPCMGDAGVCRGPWCYAKVACAILRVSPSLSGRPPRLSVCPAAAVLLFFHAWGRMCMCRWEDGRVAEMKEPLEIKFLKIPHKWCPAMAGRRMEDGGRFRKIPELSCSFPALFCPSFLFN